MTAKVLVSFKKYMPPPLPYFKVNIYPFPLPHFASIFFAYLWSFCWPNYIVTLPRHFSFRLPGPIMCSDWLKLWRSSCHKLLSWWNCNIIEMMTGWSSTNLFIFVWIGNPKWPSPGDLFYHWTLWEFHWKTFLWETTRQIEFFALYECSLDGLVPESNMAVRANNVFCLAETLKIFLSERNCNIVEMMNGWSSTKFCFRWRWEIQDGFHFPS